MNGPVQSAIKEFQTRKRGTGNGSPSNQRSSRDDVIRDTERGALVESEMAGTEITDAGIEDGVMHGTRKLPAVVQVDPSHEHRMKAHVVS